LLVVRRAETLGGVPRQAEAVFSGLQNPDWRCILKIARAEFPRHAARGYE